MVIIIVIFGYFCWFFKVRVSSQECMRLNNNLCVFMLGGPRRGIETAAVDDFYDAFSYAFCPFFLIFVAWFIMY